ncbi:MAG: MoxR family ATPase, partial [Candidatus Competibacteraceae bacterium]|nr:MoxR family ATPase [Candidatus Competibacteraceae bacterium]
MAKFELISRDTPLKPDDPVTVVRQQDLADRTLPQFRDLSESADKYYADDDLLLVINMALHTGAPLLLTGEPGTGKTQAAEFIRRYFGIPLFKFFVKSTSMAQDLMYEFDAVGYLHWAQSDKKTLQGDALTQETEAIRENFLHQRALWQAYDHEGDCVVLIDEIDKAPRDFPNDLLHEFDQHHFPHPFDPKNTIKPKSKRPPIIVITSNDERRLPDAFLRRCIFH